MAYTPEYADMELFSDRWIFRNKLRIYPDLGYRPWPHHDITIY